MDIVGNRIETNEMICTIFLASEKDKRDIENIAGEKKVRIVGEDKESIVVAIKQDDYNEFARRFGLLII